MSTRPTTVDETLYDYIIAHGTREDPLLAELRAETARTGYANMQVAPDQGAFLAMLVRIVGAKRIVEVGTFTGYSSLCMARAVGSEGTVICCDVSDEWTQIARRYWAAAEVAGRIDLRLAPALDTLDALIADGQQETFDLAFLDADKENYPGYYERLVDLLRPGGVLAVDNVFWNGSVANPDDDRATTRNIHALNARAATDDRVDVSMVTVGDGLTLVRKR